MTKEEIRRHYKEKRRKLGVTELEKMSDLMLIQFQNLRLSVPDVIMSYSALVTVNEFDPINILEYCKFKNPAVLVCYPVINEEESGLTAISITPDTAFMENKYSIEEPVAGDRMNPHALDMVLIPLLSFDVNGNRVGYGKGYYDRFLKHCRKDVIKVGFSFFEAHESFEDKHDHDIPLDYCVTPQLSYSF